MNKHTHISTIISIAALIGALCFPPAVLSVETLVQMSTDGSADGETNGTAGTVPGYDIVGIRTADWQDTGDLVIENALVNSSTGDTTASDFFTNPNRVNGDTLTVQFHAHSRLNDVTTTAGGSVRNQGVKVLDLGMVREVFHSVITK